MDTSDNMTFKIKENKIKGKRDNIWKTIQKHKLLTTTVSSFILFSLLNFIMIYNFMKILQNI